MAERPVLPPIPLDVLRQIATHLDVPSALALTRTCKALRDAGEIKVWERVKVVSDFNGDETAMVSMDFLRCQGVVRARLDALKKALASYPLRAASILDLTIEPSNSFTTPLVDLVALLAPTLRTLTILPQPQLVTSPTRAGLGDKVRFTSPDFWHKLNDRVASLPILGVFRVRLLLCPIKALYQILSRAPKVDTVDIDLGIDPGYRLEDFERVAIPSLKYLIFRGQHFTAAAMLVVGLITSAPKLESCYFTGSGNGSTKNLRLIMGVLAQKQTMRSVAWLRATAVIDRQHRWKENSVGLQRLVDAHVKILEQDEGTLRIPPPVRLPTLQHYSIITYTCPSPSEFASIGLDSSIAPSTPYIRRLGSSFMRALCTRCPNLSQLEYIANSPDLYPSLRRPHDTSVSVSYFTDPAAWESKGTRGMLLRSYVKPAAEEKQGLWHVRVLTRARPDARLRDSYIAIRRGWLDFTTFKGRMVPANVLRNVYDICGIRWDWVDGGRRMELAQEGWQVLEEWWDREAQAPGSDTDEADDTHGSIDDDDDDDDSLGSLDDDDDDDEDGEDGMGNEWDDVHDEDDIDDGDGWGPGYGYEHEYDDDDGLDDM